MTGITAAHFTVGRIRLRSAGIARLYFFDYKSIDFVDYYHKWYDYLKYNGGFRALKVQFGNYNYPYLYLLAFTTYLPISPLVAVKAIAGTAGASTSWLASFEAGVMTCQVAAPAQPVPPAGSLSG